MIIDCISDIHGYLPELEGGDLLIIAGDCTATDKVPEWHEFFNWLHKQEYRKKILIGGNHDNYLVNAVSNNDPRYKWYLDILKKEHGEDSFMSFEYLKDSGCEFEGLKIWGTPWTRSFPKMNPACKAFTLDTEEELEGMFCEIPIDTDILISHSAAWSILDEKKRDYKCPELKRTVNLTTRLGSTALLERLDIIKPRLFVCGHIHEGHGYMLYKQQLVSPCRDTKCVNAAIMNECYAPINKPIRVIL